MILNQSRSATAKQVAEVCQVALDYHAGSLATIPLRLDRSKSPLIPWREYQHRFPTTDEVRQWFSQPAGIAIVTGAISGGLEVLDFDQHEVFFPWQSLTTGIIERLPVVETAGGGWHVFYRCPEICRNTKIAKWEPADSPTFIESGSRRHCNNRPVKGVRIETRGEGGYVVAAGSPKEVHGSGRVYAQVMGPPLPEIPTITPEERKTLWKAAAEFDCGSFVSPMVQQAKREIRGNLADVWIPDHHTGGITPWDDFDRRANWSDILEPHGWTHLGKGTWRRPNRPEKRKGGSATVGKNDEGIEVLTVFSTDAGALSAPTSGTATWGRFRAYAALNHGGDGPEAARAICKLGYGKRSVA